MYAVALVIHVLVSLALILVVLLQSGKGGGLAGAFGGAGGVGAAFGGQAAATFLSKSTRYLAIAFMVTSLGLAFLIRGRGTGTVTDAVMQRQAVPAGVAGEVVPDESPLEMLGDEGESQETGVSGGETEATDTPAPVPPEGTGE